MGHSSAMTALIFIFLTVSPFFATGSSLFGIGKCVDNQVELNGHDDFHFIAIGDWGSGHHHQDEVADAIGNFCFWNRCDIGDRNKCRDKDKDKILGTSASGTDATSSSPPGTTCTRRGWTDPLTRSSQRSGKMCTSIPA